MLSCKEVTALVTDYVEGRLSFTERIQFRIHMIGCPHCRRYLRQMRVTQRALGALPVESIPLDVQ